MAKEELEEVIEYEEYADYFGDKTEKDKSGQVKFKSVNHRKRAETNEVESDGEIVTYANYALEYFGHRCALSGERFVVFDNPVEREGNARITTNLSAEHIVALTTGGNDIIPNIVPTVLQYNVQKKEYYILDWWPKAKDVNGNPIYTPEKLLKIANYMLKSLQARRDLGIKKQPREYRKRLLTPNEIDKFLMQEEIAEGLISDTITATTEVEDGKNVLTQIPQQEGVIPSLAKQKDKETKITETMFLTDALEVLRKEEKIPQEIIAKLQDMYKDVEGEIPFEIEVRRNILHALEQMGIENNKYTVANDLLVNSGLLDQVKNTDNSEIQSLIEEYLKRPEEKLREILSGDQTKIAISNMPESLYNETIIERIKFWKEYRKESVDELLIQHTATDEFIDILIVLKDSGIDLSDIKYKSKVIDLIENKDNKEEILKKLKNISQEIDEQWPLGGRLYIRKSENLKQLEIAIQESGIDLTDKEKKIILTIEDKQELSKRLTEEFVEVLKVLKGEGIDLSEIKREKQIIHLIQNKENKKEILKRLADISEEITEEWHIGKKLSNQKHTNLKQLKIAIEESGIELTEREKNIILRVENYQELSKKLTEEFVEVLKVLKGEGIDLSEITKGKQIIDLIENKENKKEILKRLANISEEITEEWPVSDRLNNQKSRNLKQLEIAIEESEIELTAKEKRTILKIENHQELSKRLTQEFVEVLKVLKGEGIDLSEIKREKQIIHLIQNKENKKEILKRIAEISVEITEEWPIGERLHTQRKDRNLKQLEIAIEESGMELSEKERKKILEKRNSKKTIKNIINDNKEGLSETMQVGEELEAEIAMAEKLAERSASDGRGQ